MKTLIHLFLSVIAVSVFFMDQASAQVPRYDDQGVAAYQRCPQSGGRSIYHFDKIVFKIRPNTSLLADSGNSSDTAALNRLPRGYELDIKINDDPRYIADIKGKVLSYLGSLDNSYYRSRIEIVDVEYSAVVCS